MEQRSLSKFTSFWNCIHISPEETNDQGDHPHSLLQSFPLLLLPGNSNYRQNQPESIQFLWPFFSLVLTVRTAVPFVSSVRHVIEILESIFGQSKANLILTTCLNLMLFLQRSEALLVLMCMRNSCKTPNSAYEIISLYFVMPWPAS